MTRENLKMDYVPGGDEWRTAMSRHTRDDLLAMFFHPLKKAQLVEMFRLWTMEQSEGGKLTRWMELFRELSDLPSRGINEESE